MQAETSYTVILGQIIKEKRTVLGITQQEISDDVGINRITWSKIETGEAAVNIVLLKNIAKTLGTSPNEILLEADEALKFLEAKGIKVHPEAMKTVKKNSSQGGAGLALLAGAALSVFIAMSISDNKK